MIIISMLIMMVIPVAMIGKQVSITQMGFIIRKAIPVMENIAVLYPVAMKDTVVKDVRRAQTIVRKKFVIYDISNKQELNKKISTILKTEKPAVIIFTDDLIFSPKTIQSLSEKFSPKGIPIFTNRKGDTKSGALVSLFYNDSGKLVKHLSKDQLALLKIQLPEDVLSQFSVDSN